MDDQALRPVADGLLAGLRASRGAHPTEISEAEEALGTQLPADLRAFIELADGAEGWVLGSYLAMWPIARLAELNAAAGVTQFVPDLVFFATDGGGEGYAFVRDARGFVNAPMVGMHLVERTIVGASFDAFIGWLASQASDDDPPEADPTRRGLVIYEQTPIIVGGNPTDPGNKTLVPLEKYVELVGWWNRRLSTRETSS